MKSFRFDNLYLLAVQERRARALSFGRGATAIIGRNHRGKSTIIRMLFYAFGCDTKPLGPQWTKDFAVEVTFSVEDVQYSAFRNGPVFAIFDANRNVVWAGNDNSSFRDALAPILGFNLRLTPREGDARLARMAFFFLPSYVDQDGSWESQWNTFRSLGEFKDWQSPTIDFYLGVRPARYWDMVADFSSAKMPPQRY